MSITSTFLLRTLAAMLLACAAPTLYAEEWTLERDAAGRPSRIGSAGADARFEYDAQGRLNRYMQTGVGQVDIVRDAQGRIAGLNGTDGLEERYTYDAKGRVVALERGRRPALGLAYDAADRLIEMHLPSGPARRVTYDPAGRITQVADAMGRVSQYQYDALGRLVAEIDAAGAKTQYSYDARGRLAQVVEPGGADTRYAYNRQGQLLRVTGPGGTEQRFEYATDGSLKARIAPGGGRVTHTYDPRKRQLVITEPLGTATFVLDTAGRIVRQVDRDGLTRNIDYDQAGRPTRIVHPDARVERFVYDRFGRLSLHGDGLGAERRYSYDRRGRLTRVEQGGRVVAEYQHDVLDRPVSRRDALGRLTAYRYDGAGRLLETTGPSGAVARIVRDAEGRVTRLVNPDGGATQFVHGPLDLPSEIVTGTGRVRQTYTVDGLLAMRGDARGRVTRYSHDARGRVARIEYDGQVSDFIHGDDDRLVRVKAKQAGQVFSHDREGRLTGIDTEGVGRVTYAFNGAGRVELVGSPSGAKVKWRYDNLQRPVAVLLPDGAGEIAFTWALGGRLTGIALPNGIQARLAHDAEGRLARLAWQARDGQPMMEWRLGYDALGMPVEARGGATHLTFNYDAESRLVAEKRGNRQIDYIYSPGGDRLARREGGRAETYVYRGGVLTRIGERAFGHDADGRMILGGDPAGRRAYLWDGLGRLVGVETGSTSFSLEYDASNQWVGLSDARGKTVFAYDRDQLLEERGPGGGVLYIHAPGIDRPLAMRRDGTWSYFLWDWMGSVVAVVDAQGRPVANFERDAFGRLLDQSGRSGDSRFGFQGRPCLPEIGLCWFRQRWYDPSLGRFLSADPVFGEAADPQSLNRYAFGRNAPTRYGDPMGTEPWDWRVDYRLEAQRTGVPESVLKDLTREVFAASRAPDPRTPGWQADARTAARMAHLMVRGQADWVWHQVNGTYGNPEALTTQQAYNIMRANLRLDPRTLATPGTAQITVDAPIAPRPPSQTPVAGVQAAVDPNVVDLAALQESGSGPRGGQASGAITEGNLAAPSGPRPSLGQIAGAMLESAEPPIPAAEPVPGRVTQIVNPEAPPPARSSPPTLRDPLPIRAGSAEAGPAGGASEAGPGRISAGNLAAGLGVAGVLGGVTASADCYARGGDAKACAQAGAMGTGIGVGTGAVAIAVVETVKAGLAYTLGTAAATAFGTTAAVAGTALGFGAAGTAIGNAGVRLQFGSPEEQKASAATLAKLDARIAELNDLSRAASETLGDPLKKAKDLDAALAGVRSRGDVGKARAEACAAARSALESLAKMADAVADPALDAFQRLRDAESPDDAANDTRIAVEVVKHAARETNGVERLAELAVAALGDVVAGLPTAKPGESTAEDSRKLILAYNQAVERLAEAIDAALLVKTRFDAAKRAAEAEITSLRTSVHAQDASAFDRRVALIQGVRFAAEADLTHAKQMTRDAGKVLGASVTSTERQAGGAEQARSVCAEFADAAAVARTVARGQAAVARMDAALARVAGGVAARARKVDEASQKNQKILAGAPVKLAAAKAAGDKEATASLQRLLTAAETRQAKVIVPQQSDIAKARSVVEAALAALKTAAASLAKGTP